MGERVPIYSGKRYYGSAHVPIISGHNPFDEVQPSIFLCTCAAPGCSKVETIEKRFSRCPKCMTRYCSRECQVRDHKEGIHKVKCASFMKTKDEMQKGMCSSCWPSKWREISDPDNTIGKGTIHTSCPLCIQYQYTLNMDDEDIQRVWLE